MLNMTINTVGTLNLSTEFGALLVFSVFIASTSSNNCIPGLIKMSAFDWSMTRWYKTHATSW
jgi:uncharacterized membrane protein